MREKAKLSRQALADAALMPAQRLGRIEREEVSPTINELVRISVALDTPLIVLLYGEDSGFIDISKMWPSSRAVLADLAVRVRVFEQMIEDEWAGYCRDFLGIEKPPRPPWRPRKK